MPQFTRFTESMKGMRFSVGLALLVVAAAVAATITLRPAAPKESAVGALTQRVGAPAARADSRPGRETDHDRQAVAAARERAVAASLGTPLTVDVPPEHPAWATLVPKARLVEAHARERLEHMAQKLVLTVAQQRKLFPVFARESVHYDPAMMPTGGQFGALALSAAEVEREFQKNLTPEQRDRLVEDALDDQVLWEEIISGLRRKLAEQTPQIATGAASEPEPAADPAPPRRNLFDTVNPER